jgi:CRISPR/Cas system-associated exonuclease Cas4 (RecB family)
MKGKSMTDAKELLLSVLHEKDASKSRSKQKQVGPSEIGGCRRKVWYRLNDQPETNDNLSKLAAIMGTAIHTEIEKAIESVDPTGKKYMVETEVEYGDIKAHVDLFVPETGDVIDWKTVKVKNLSYFPSTQQRWQVQIYGYLLTKSGHKVNRVSLCAIARDGDERDVKVHTEDYDESLALEALSWLEAIKASTEAPEPEKDENFCKSYCQFYDASGQLGCVGLKKERIASEQVLIQDKDASTNAMKYLQLDEKIKELTKEKDSLKSALEGIAGVTDTGIQVRWHSVAGPTSVDKEEVLAKLGFVPTKQGADSLRLTIKQSGGK